MGEQIGQRLGKFVGLDQPVTLVARALQSAELFATRLRWQDTPQGNPTCFARMDGYLVCVQRRSLPSNPYWVDGHPVPLEPLRRGQFLLIDVRQQHAALVRGNVDCVSFYASREALERFCAEHDLPPGPALRARPGVAFNDEVVRQLGECMLPAFDRPDRASQLFIDHVTLALLSHLTEFYGERAAASAPLRGGLQGDGRRAAPAVAAGAAPPARKDAAARIRPAGQRHRLQQRLQRLQPLHPRFHQGDGCGTWVLAACAPRLGGRHAR